MARIPRYHIIEDGSTFHITWQCHNKAWLLESEWAKRAYYNLLLMYKDRYRIEIYSYCFMSNHPHLTGRVEKREDLSDFFRVVNSRLAKLINRKQSRRGQVVMDRFKSLRIESDEDLLRVMIYNDLNPIRAKMVKRPEDHRWSSYRYYAFGAEDPLITPAASYIAMGETSEERQRAYRKMIEDIVAHERATGKSEKKAYSSTYFIGNPDWVVKRHTALMAEVTAQREAALLRYRARFGSGPPVDTVFV